MAKRIAIMLGKAMMTAELLEEDAPKTCKAVWDRLPLEGQAMPSITSGSEVFLTLGPSLGIPFENQTIYPIPGDLVFYLQPRSYVDGEVKGHERHRETIAIVYGRDVQMYGPVVPLSLNLFATAVDGLAEFSAEVAKMKREGFGRLSISKAASGKGE